MCTGSRVVAKTQDLLLEGGVRAHTGGLKMVGTPHEAFPRDVEGVWVGGCVLTGGKRSGTNEPVRFLMR